MIIQKAPIYLSSNSSQPSFQAKTKVVTNNIKTATLNLNEVGVGIAGVVGSLLVAKQNKQTDFFERCLQLKDSNNFENYKQSLLEFLKKNEYDKIFIDNIQESSNNEELNTEFELFVNYKLSASELLNSLEFNILEKINNNEFSPELDRLIMEFEIMNSDKVVPVAKLASKTDQSAEILAIKKELATKYNQKNLFLNNDIELAKSCVEAFEILKKNNIHYNGTIVSLDDADFGGINIKSSDGTCVIINPNCWQVDGVTTTHLILHEILHTLQPKALEFSLKPIPKEFQEIIPNISEYADGNDAGEIHCELYVKKLIQGLSKEEYMLFNYLGGSFLE